MTRRIMLFELNEVPWRIVDEFVADHPTSALARLTSWPVWSRSWLAKSNRWMWR